MAAVANSIVSPATKRPAPKRKPYFLASFVSALFLDKKKTNFALIVPCNSPYDCNLSVFTPSKLYHCLKLLDTNNYLDNL